MKDNTPTQLRWTAGGELAQNLIAQFGMDEAFLFPMKNWETFKEIIDEIENGR